MVVSAGQIFITPVARAAVDAERARLEGQLLERSIRLTDGEERRERGAPTDNLPIMTPLGAIYKLLDSATVIDPADRRGLLAAVGTRVTIVAEDGETEQFTLTTPPWTDPQRRLVSWDSPVGRAVMGRRPGDTVLVQAPGGSWAATISQIVEA